MFIITKHKFHLVNRSQLPFLASGFAFLLTSGIVFYLHTPNLSSLVLWDNIILQISLNSLTIISLSWFLMIIYESGQGYHTTPVQNGLRYGFWLFLVSEAMLFFSFFWAYFHFSLNPSIVMGHQWPPELGIQRIDPYKIPLLNTILLLSSGVTATVSHRAVLNTDFIWNPYRKYIFYTSLITTIILGYIFLICQGIEYTYGLQQSWMSNVYWSIFFLLTGFHGFHVVVGTLFLQFNFVRVFLCFNSFNILYVLLKLINLFYINYGKLHLFIYNKLSKNNKMAKQKKILKFIVALKDMLSEKESLFIKNNKSKDESYLTIFKLLKYNIATNQHLGFESALYYWHFVDAIWILLYMVVYLWGR